jgi:hypothetical protein
MSEINKYLIYYNDDIEFIIKYKLINNSKKPVYILIESSYVESKPFSINTEKVIKCGQAISIKLSKIATCSFLKRKNYRLILISRKTDFFIGDIKNY